MYENNRIDLLMQWDADANLPLTPETVTSGSSRKVKVTAKQEYYEKIVFKAQALEQQLDAAAEKKILHIITSYGPGPPLSVAKSSPDSS